MREKIIAEKSSIFSKPHLFISDMWQRLTILAIICSISFADVGDDVEKNYNKAKDAISDAATAQVIFRKFRHLNGCLWVNK